MPPKIELDPDLALGLLAALSVADAEGIDGIPHKAPYGTPEREELRLRIQARLLRFVAEVGQLQPEVAAEFRWGTGDL